MAAIAAPHTTTATITIRPSRRTRGSQPAVSAAMAAPAETAANIAPVPLAPAWKTLTARTGKSARGIPNVIAHRSMKNEPVSARLARTKRSPSPIEASTPGSSSWAARSLRFGRWGESRKAATIIARQLAASTT